MHPFAPPASLSNFACSILPLLLLLDILFAWRQVDLVPLQLVQTVDYRVLTSIPDAHGFIRISPVFFY